MEGIMVLSESDLDQAGIEKAPVWAECSGGDAAIEISDGEEDGDGAED